MLKPSLPPEREQHDAHRRAWLDFWCAQLDRRIAYYERQDARRGIDDDTKDAADEALGIAR